MNRRDFLKAASLGLFAVQLGCSLLDPEKRKERSLFRDFKDWYWYPMIDRKIIEGCLYEVMDSGATKGRAFHIGDGYLLTCAHLIEGLIQNLDIKYQGSGRYSRQRFHFEKLKVDHENDIGLIKLSVDYKRRGKALMHLNKEPPKVGDDVSFFTRLYGRPRSHEYDLSYGGLDFYDEKKVVRLGRMILHKNSLLFERQGQILEYREEELMKISEDKKANRDNECFSSAMTRQGDSGSPIFLRKDENKYLLTGIVTQLVSAEHMIPTPGIPLGYTKMQQRGAVFAHRKPIADLIDKYLEER